MASDELQRLYQQLILEHSKQKHGYGLKADAAASSHQINPTCGDEVTLQVHAHDGVIESVSWEGQGCSISQASASLLNDIVDDLSIAGADERIAAFRELMQSKGAIEGDDELLGDAVALAGVSKYVARIKCAMLPWVAFEDALLSLR